MNKIKIFSGLTLLGRKKLSVPAILVTLCILCGCTLDGDKAPDRSRFTFKTGDDTELFFKNVRQSDYDLEVNEAAKFNVFRHEDRPQNDSMAWIMPVIVMNYMQDEAYILIEHSPALENEQIWETIAGGDTVRLSSPNRVENLEFASQLYEHLKAGDSIMVRKGNQMVPLFNEREHSEAFRITMSDYYRLTRVF